ncbi:MAG: hypothetical protein RL380_1629 [Verrucomicrobiota bacterium]
MISPANFPRRARAAFSLIELMITLVVICILTALMWSRSSANFQRTRKELCEANLQKIYMALNLFANDHAGQLPAAPAATTAEEPLAQLVPTCTVDTAIFICPGSKDTPLPPSENFAARKISYAYYMGAVFSNATAALVSDRQINTAAKKSGDPIFSSTGQPPGGNHHKFGGNVLYGDGHVAPSAPKLLFDLPLSNGVVLLNPRS